MKDLDFDELDRAVNSLMANVTKTTPPADDDQEKTLSIDSTLDADTPPPFDKVEETAAKATEEIEPASVPSPDPVAVPSSDGDATPSQPAVTAAHAAAVHARPQPAATPTGRRGGRFMDVVHPSADMKKPDAPKPISRQGATIEPLNASAQKIADIVPSKKPKMPEEKPVGPSAIDTETMPKEEQAQPSPVLSSSSEQPQAPTASQPEKTDEPSSESDWPDPLDMAKPSETEIPELENEDTGNPVLPAELEPKVEEPVPAPLTTPFLPDAKVEKRPLGGLSGHEDANEVEEPSRAPVLLDDTKKTIDDPNAQLPADPNAVEPQLPEELSGDLMAVEADTTHDEIKQAHESKLGSVALDQHTSPVANEPVAQPAAKEPDAPSGPTSIPQQYREEPSTGDKDNGAIYDTDTYHQPLSHPAKKKPEWMWVVWIVAILLLGAGGGAALYFLGIV